MSQNIPPNTPGNPYEQDDQDPRTASQAGTDNVGANPYYSSQHNAAPPDLDANAPLLKSNDLQRLNRKALFFLAGIVALLVLATVWMLKSATGGKEEQEKPREETVVIPELPQRPPAESAPADVAPIDVASSELPPLPEDPAALEPGAYQEAPRGPTLLERRMMSSDPANVEGGGDDSGALDGYRQGQMQALQGAGNPALADGRRMELANVSSARFINKPGALLVRGTYIRCVLETRIITDVPGFTSCVVTEPIYSINGRSLLLPKGSKISGTYRSGASSPRVSVIWDRITTPNGIDVNMSSPGIDNLGGAGHPGDYNAHWGSRISSALLISLISDAFKYAAAEHGPETTTITDSGLAVQSPYESATARTMERLANQALDGSRPPTVTINQGTVVNVYVAKDVDFSGVLAQY
jgi:type IV secretion system protein VirB10